MDGAVNRKYLMDSVIIVFFIIFTWTVLAFVFSNVYGLKMDQYFRIATMTICIAAGVFATSALCALLVHLRRNRDSLYVE